MKRRGGWKISIPRSPAQLDAIARNRKKFIEARVSKTDAERFAEALCRIEKTGACWIWKGATNDRGYGQIGVRGKLDYVHRLAYRASIGQIPEGLDLDHLCRNPPCCNPAHLEPVTRAENQRRAHFRTVCKRGHNMEGEGAYVSPRGKRMCRACSRERERTRSARREVNS
jgi:hypothetical protein